MALETSEDPIIIELCLDGFKVGIHIAGILGMATERDSMVSALCNYTALDPISGPRPGVRTCAMTVQWVEIPMSIDTLCPQSAIHEFRLKNIESTKTLVSIVLSEGNYIGSSWGPLLHCISQVCSCVRFGARIKLYLYLNRMAFAAVYIPVTCLVCIVVLMSLRILRSSVTSSLHPV